MSVKTRSDMEGRQLPRFTERQREKGLLGGYTGMRPLKIDWKKVLRGHKYMFTAGQICESTYFYCSEHTGLSVACVQELMGTF